MFQWNQGTSEGDNKRDSLGMGKKHSPVSVQHPRQGKVMTHFRTWEWEEPTVEWKEGGKGKGKLQTCNPSFGWKIGKLNSAVCYSAFFYLLWVTEPPNAAQPHSWKHFPPSSEIPAPDRQDLFPWRIPSCKCQVYFCTLFGEFFCLANSSYISLASQALLTCTSPESSLRLKNAPC